MQAFAHFESEKEGNERDRESDRDREIDYINTATYVEPEDFVEVEVGEGVSRRGEDGEVYVEYEIVCRTNIPALVGNRRKSASTSASASASRVHTSRVWRRYRDFVALAHAINHHHGGDGGSGGNPSSSSQTHAQAQARHARRPQLPPLPPGGVRAWTQSVRERDVFLRERRVGLERFLQAALSHPLVQTVPELRSFLGL